MPGGCWKLAAMYFVVLNHRLHQRGWPRLSFGRMIGAVFAHHVVTHAEEIYKEFDAVRLEAFKWKHPQIYDAKQLDAIATAGSAQIPEILGISTHTHPNSTRNKKARAV